MDEKRGPLDIAGRKVAIVGTSKTTRYKAPVDDPDWAIWTLGNNYKKANVPRRDLHFEIHNFDDGVTRWHEDYIKWLRKPTDPVIVQADTSHCPSGIVYPLADAIDAFERYFTCSIAYMIALATLKGAKAIGIYGCDLAQDVEYAYQRPSVEYHIGYARGQGIEVLIPDTSDHEIESKKKEQFILAGALENMRWMQQWRPVQFQGDGEAADNDE